MSKRIEAVVSGHVQGVSFRYYTQREAQRLGVTGWVANKPDGTVRAVAEGDEDALQQFVDWLHEGPSHARVRNVDVSWSDAKNEFGQFAIRR